MANFPRGKKLQKLKETEGKGEEYAELYEGKKLEEGMESNGAIYNESRRKGVRRNEGG